MFVLVLEGIFKKLAWNNREVEINTRLAIRMIADDVVITGDNNEDIKQMILKVNEEAKWVGPNMNIARPKWCVMCDV